MAVQKAVQRVATRVGLMVVKMVVTRVSLKAVNWDHSTVGLMDLMKVGEMVHLMVVEMALWRVGKKVGEMVLRMVREMDTVMAQRTLMALLKDLLLGMKLGIVLDWRWG